jgi:polyisoprenoid-binding protein YceI
MIAQPMLAPGTHQLGPANGRIEVHTFREGLAQKVGHDLIIELSEWSATVVVSGEGVLESISFRAQPASLRVREGLGGVKPLTDSDRAEIERNIQSKVLGSQEIAFASSAVDATGGLTVRGELSIAGATRPQSFELMLAEDGRLSGKLRVVQTEFGIKPYRGLMGALKVRDEVEIHLDVALPAG